MKSYRDFSEFWEILGVFGDEKMEQIFEHHVQSRRADKFSSVKQNLFSASNAVFACTNGAKWKPKFADSLLEGTKKLTD